MYICNSCQSVFNEPVYQKSNSFYSEENVSKDEFCPYCEARNCFEEVSKCCPCGRYIVQNEVLCEECKEDSISSFLKIPCYSREFILENWNEEDYG